MSSSGAARERAKAMREEQARSQRRRERVIRVAVAAGVLLVVVGAAVAVAVGRSGGGGDDTSAVPEAATESGDGVAVGDESAPVTIDAWIDFQCPHCREFEETKADVLDELVADGTARVIYHPAAFLGEESERAAAAFGCAADAGEPAAFLRELFANQPAERSGGYTEDDLLARGEAVGLSDAEFRTCVTEGTYAGWGDRVTDAMRDAGFSATPAVLVDGEQLDNPVVMSPDDFRAAVETAGAGN